MKEKVSAALNFFKQKPLILLAIIILAQVCVIFHYAGKRNNLHTDEVFILDHIVSNNYGMLHKWFNAEGYVPSEQLKDYFKLDKGQRFNYSRVYKESKKDTPIPPAYNLLIYTLYSVYFSFFDNFSIYPGIIFNVIFFILTNILLYFTSRFLLDEKSALFPSLLWGFSAGAINCALYLRIYALAAFFFTALIYVIFNIIKNKTNNAKHYIFLLFVVYCGILTHYSFITWLAMVLPILLVWFVINKKWTELLKSTATAASAFVLSALSYPVMDNLLNSGTGKTAQKHIFNFSVVLENSKLMFDQYCKSYFGFGAEIAVIITVLLAIFFVIRHMRQKAKQHAAIGVADKRIFALITSLSIAFIPFIGQVAQLKIPRYIWPAAPISIVFFCFMLYFLIGKTFSFTEKSKMIIMTAAIICLVIFGFFNREINFDRLGISNHPHEKTSQFNQQYRDMAAVCVADGNSRWAITGVLYYLTHMRGSAFVSLDKLNNLNEILSGIDISQGFILFISNLPKKPDYGEILNLLKQAGFKGHKHLFGTRYCEAYHIT